MNHRVPFFCPAPKPEPKIKEPKRMSKFNAKRKGSSFPKERDKEYCVWVVTHHPCILRGAIIRKRVSVYDIHDLGGFRHRCFGDKTPMHVGKHRAKGAPDFGAVLCACQALHDFYDHHRSEFRAVTGLTEKQLATMASGMGLAYVEQGGIPVHRESE